MQDLSDFGANLGGRRGQVNSGEFERRERIAVVGPQGQFKVVEVGGGRLGSTSQVVYVSSETGRARIPEQLQAMQPDGFPAWIRYDDLCARTGEVEFFHKWKKFDDVQVERKRRGQKMILLPQVAGEKSERDPTGRKYAYRPVPEGWYHPLVEARRGKHNHGRPEMDMDAILDIRIEGDQVYIDTGRGELPQDLAEELGVATTGTAKKGRGK